MTTSDLNDDLVLSKLAELADEHFLSVGKDWAGRAQLIRGRGPLPSGEGFGCTVGSRYFEVGEEEQWLGDNVGGDILLTAYATTYSQDGDEFRTVSRSITLKRDAAG